MNKKQKKKKKRKAIKYRDIELNIMPFIDVFSLLNTFLLMSAVFIAIGVLEVQIPFLSSAPPDTKDNERTLDISVDVEKEKIEVTTVWSRAPENEAQREQAPLKTLIDAVMIKDPRYGFTSSNAMLALGVSRLEESLDILIEQSVIGKNPYKSRRGAADGIGALLPYLPKNIRRKAEERLVDLLRDPDDWMRRAAAGALFSAKVQWAENSLLSFRASLPFQDQMDFDGRMAGLRKGGESKIADLEKQVEDVNGRYRKLLERLENIEARLAKT